VPHLGLSFAEAEAQPEPDAVLEARACTTSAAVWSVYLRENLLYVC